ncbi:hypothetical protein BBP40_006830 [Aspergillus hancockii]|nr:hypothetical protein BBP40_006830 [Aspergillus hancockii]
MYKGSCCAAILLPAIFLYPEPDSSPTTTQRLEPAYSNAVKHLNTRLKTTTWGSWLPSKTIITAADIDDPYGQTAWSSLWQQADIENCTTTGLYSTTVSPTPVPTSEFVLLPRDYFPATDCYNFPRDFIFGVAGSAAQVEGAVGLEGRGPTIQEKLDIQRLAAMGVKYYSFSIPWTRILPFILPGSPVNEQGIRHYYDLINTVLDAGMQPIVTLLHFDTPWMFVSSDNPSAKPDIGVYNGGYQNETFLDTFVNYAKIVLSHYADRVPVWVTFNEPYLYSFIFAGANNILGIKFNDNFGVPRDPSIPRDFEAANHFQDMQLGIFANPIFLGEQYPDSVLATLPGAKTLSTQGVSYIANTSDFFGIDPYTATVVLPPADGIDSCATNQSTKNSLWPLCVVQETKNVYGWNIGYRVQSYVIFELSLEYFRHPVFVPEFGYPVFGEADKSELSDQLFDTPRSLYCLSFMSEILRAIHEDGVNVMGVLAWSYADNWEFGDYAQQFGLQVVNRTTQHWFYKKSFFDLVDFVGARLPL